MRSPKKRVPTAETERSPGLRVAVMGATGLVGREIISQFRDKEFVEEVVPFASARSVGQEIAFRDQVLTIQPLTSENIKGFDLALFSAGNEVSKQWAPRFSADGCAVVDNSSQWRMHPEVPLVAAGVNDYALDGLVTRETVRQLGYALEKKGLAWRLLQLPDGTLHLEVQ